MFDNLSLKLEKAFQTLKGQGSDHGNQRCHHGQGNP